MPTMPTAPATLATLQALQNLILASTGTTFATLSAADVTRYGVARAVYIGAPKDLKDTYMPQCQIRPVADAVARVGEQGRVTDELLVAVTALAGMDDWWQAEQTLLSIRDALWPLFVAHVRGGASAGASLVALDLPPEHLGGESFVTVEAAGVWYRAWTCHVVATQIWAPAGGYAP